MPHGIMFHHLHDDQHIEFQGSLSGQQFEETLHYLMNQYNLLSADEWFNRAVNHELCSRDVCITFDDNLRCQFDVAYPILKKYNLKAFWFIYTSPFKNVAEKIEVYSYFRARYFKTIDDFYERFFDLLSQSQFSEIVALNLESFVPADYLKEFSFYTDNDRKFRYLRDLVLGPLHYNQLMDQMLEAYKVDMELLKKLLWMSPDQIKQLHAEGHIIGAHTHTHPTRTEDLPQSEQFDEYQSNCSIIKSIIGVSPLTMSHPCNSYNDSTLTILGQLGIQIGFRSNLSLTSYSQLEYPRNDIANLVKEMKHENYGVHK